MLQFKHKECTTDNPRTGKIQRKSNGALRILERVGPMRYFILRKGKERA